MCISVVNTNNFRFAWLLLMTMGLLQLSGAVSADGETISAKANNLSGFSLLEVSDFKNASFSPARGEKFVIPVITKDPENIKKIDVEIRTSDDDLVKTIMFDAFEKDKNTYEITWDGKDSSNKVVPDEAYFPVVITTDKSNKTERIDGRSKSGGEEVYEFEKHIRAGAIEYTLPAASRMLIRSGIKNGPMLRTIIDWQPRTAGFHAERWNGRDLDDVIAIERNPKVGYLIIGYQLPNYSIITYGNTRLTYRAYREQKKWPLKQADFKNRLLEREGKLIRPEFYTPVTQQKSPRITVNLLNKASRKPIAKIKGFEELITEVKLHPLDELYLDQERYEISFFINNEFIAEEEQGFVPFTWRWSPKRLGLKPGKHVLTVNVSGYSGQVGVRNIAFILEDAKTK